MFITLRQEMLLSPIRSQVGRQMMAQFIQEDFRPLKYQALKAIGQHKTLEGVWELMKRGWFKRSGNGEYAIAGKVVSEFRKGVG